MKPKLKVKTKVIKHSNYFGEGYGVMLTIGVQSFKLDCVNDTKVEAKWHAQMMMRALENLKAHAVAEYKHKNKIQEKKK